MDESITNILSIMDDLDVGMGQRCHDTDFNNDCDDSDSLEQGYSPKDYVLANKFVNLVGGSERAKNLLEKLDEISEVLDLNEDRQQIEEGHVNAIANNCREY